MLAILHTSYLITAQAFREVIWIPVSGKEHHVAPTNPSAESGQSIPLSPSAVCDSVSMPANAINHTFVASSAAAATPRHPCAIGPKVSTACYLHIWLQTLLAEHRADKATGQTLILTFQY